MNNHKENTQVNNSTQDNSTQDILNEMDYLKNQWQEVNKRLDLLQATIMEEGKKIVTEKYCSARKVLILKYQKFVIIALLMILAIPLIFYHMLLDMQVDRINTIIIIIMFEIYFITAASFDRWLMIRWKRIDMIRWNVKEVSVEASSLRYHHHLFMIIMIVLAIITIGFFIYNVMNEPIVVTGICCGGIIGAIFGIRDYRKMMNAYKEVISTDESEM